MVGFIVFLAGLEGTVQPIAGYCAPGVSGWTERMASSTSWTDGLTSTWSPTKTVGTISSPPVASRTRAAASSDDQMLSSTVATPAQLSPWSSEVQKGQPGLHITSTVGGEGREGGMLLRRLWVSLLIVSSVLFGADRDTYCSNPGPLREIPRRPAYKVTIRRELWARCRGGQELVRRHSADVGRP